MWCNLFLRIHKEQNHTLNDTTNYKKVFEINKVASFIPLSFLSLFIFAGPNAYGAKNGNKYIMSNAMSYGQ